MSMSERDRHPTSTDPQAHSDEDSAGTRFPADGRDESEGGRLEEPTTAALRKDGHEEVTRPVSFAEAPTQRNEPMTASDELPTPPAGTPYALTGDVKRPAAPPSFPDPPPAPTSDSSARNREKAPTVRVNPVAPSSPPASPATEDRTSPPEAGASAPVQPELTTAVHAPEPASPAHSWRSSDSRQNQGPPGPDRDSAAPSSEAAEDAPAAPPTRRLGRVVWRIFKYGSYTGLALAVVGAIALFFVIRHHEQQLPSVEQLKQYEPPQVTRVLAADGTLLANLFTERRTVVQLNDIPDHAKLAFLAAEDAGFYEHEGLDYFGMLRALAANLRAGETRQGGSTITQQLVKNVLLNPRRTYERKLQETILARRIEQNLSKDEILWLYLNHIYLGHGRYGIEEAARFYFGKKSKELNLAESATLAGLVASPERFSPRKSPELALQRRAYVLRQMLRKGFVTEELQQKAKETPLRLAPEVEAESELAPEVVRFAKATLSKAAGDAANQGGFVIRTSIDPSLQAAARQAVRENLQRYAKRHKLAPPYTEESRKLWGEAFEGSPRPYKIYVGKVTALDDEDGTIDVQVGDVVGRVLLNKEERYNPDHLPPSEFAKVGAALRVSLLAKPEAGGPPPPLRLELGPQSALVAMDVRTGKVLALVGSYEAIMGGLDRATQARRQPGSAFKPFVYSYALHSRRLTPASMLELPDRSPRPPDGEVSDEPATRSISVRQAIAQSDNDAAVAILEEVGAANVVQWAHALGVGSKLEPTPSLALGAYEVTPLEMATAYTAFASGGKVRTPQLITQLLSPSAEGSRPIELPATPPARTVMQPDEAYLVTSLLSSVVQEGTARKAQALGRPVAGKTGTTNDARDAWFVGYSPEIVTAVWVGYDDASPLGRSEAGSVTALPAWIDFMKAAHRERAKTEFARPSDIVVACVDPATGLLCYPGLEGGIEEEFLQGTAPQELSSPQAADDPDVDLEAEAGELEAAQAPEAPPEEGLEAPAPTPAVPGGPVPAPETDTSHGDTQAPAAVRPPPPSVEAPPPPF